PNMGADGVNHAPFAAYGGWSGAINAKADQKVKDAAYAFLAYMSAPEQSNVDVTIGKTGFNPYRTSQFSSTAPWVKAGMSEAAAARLPLPGAWRAALSPRNVFLWPALAVVLLLSIFPLVVSLFLSLSRLSFTKAGIEITFLGPTNYQTLLFGGERTHFIGLL